MNTPPDEMVELAISTALLSPCKKSRRGVVIYARDDDDVMIYARDDDDVYATAIANGFNGPPPPLACLNDEGCRKDCARRCVHAEDRAIRDAVVRSPTSSVNAIWGFRNGQEIRKSAIISLADYDAVHVKVDEADQLVPGGRPSCWQCSRTVLDVQLGGFWLYEEADAPSPPSIETWMATAKWRRYTADEFHRETLMNCGVR